MAVASASQGLLERRLDGPLHVGSIGVMTDVLAVWLGLAQRLVDGPLHRCLLVDVHVAPLPIEAVRVGIALVAISVANSTIAQRADCPDDGAAHPPGRVPWVIVLHPLPYSERLGHLFPNHFALAISCSMAVNELRRRVGPNEGRTSVDGGHRGKPWATGALRRSLLRGRAVWWRGRSPRQPQAAGTMRPVARLLRAGYCAGGGARVRRRSV
mmetsp:Transcript_29146/g.79996  ORF Transcript_29146/g.79996 Transcript_29146/m.79996 type:complete len:212 (+) Transcript_29146:1000-1635(+)